MAAATGTVAGTKKVDRPSVAAKHRSLLFDTTALVDLYRGKSGIRPFFDALLDGRLTAFVSVVTEAELWRGLRAEEVERHEALLSGFVPLALESEAARQAGLEDLRRIVRQLTVLIEGKELEAMRRDFAAWLRRVLLPTRFRGEQLPEARDLLEIDEMLAETVKAWPKQWLAQGREEGRLEGSRKLLTSLIETKLGSPSAEARTRIEAATPAQVDRWAKRILTAASIDELFRD